jgi:beta-phosphoglucomutase-like phosphatase (HAD superfamily)
MDDLQLVIFDCDGVLVDSEPISNRVLAEALTAEGLPTTLEQALVEYKGLLLSDIVAHAEAKLGRPLPESWVEEYERDRIEGFRRELEPVPGAAEAVERVIAAGLEVCVASQGKLEKTKLTLGLTGLRELFADESLFSAYAVARGKPHPDLFLHAAKSDGSRAVAVRRRGGHHPRRAGRFLCGHACPRLRCRQRRGSSAAGRRRGLQIVG